jgi:hypothetical protein
MEFAGWKVENGLFLNSLHDARISSLALKFLRLEQQLEISSKRTEGRDNDVLVSEYSPWSIPLFVVENEHGQLVVARLDVALNL